MSLDHVDFIVIDDVFFHLGFDCDLYIISKPMDISKWNLKEVNRKIFTTDAIANVIASPIQKQELNIIYCNSWYEIEHCDSSGALIKFRLMLLQTNNINLTHMVVIFHDEYKILYTGSCIDMPLLDKNDLFAEIVPEINHLYVDVVFEEQQYAEEVANAAMIVNELFEKYNRRTSFYLGDFGFEQFVVDLIKSLHGKVQVSDNLKILLTGKIDPNQLFITDKNQTIPDDGAIILFHNNRWFPFMDKNNVRLMCFKEHAKNLSLRQQFMDNFTVIKWTFHCQIEDVVNLINRMENLDNVDTLPGKTLPTILVEAAREKIEKNLHISGCSLLESSSFSLCSTSFLLPESEKDPNSTLVVSVAVPEEIGNDDDGETVSQAEKRVPVAVPKECGNDNGENVSQPEENSQAGDINQNSTVRNENFSQLPLPEQKRRILEAVKQDLLDNKYNWSEQELQARSAVLNRIIGTEEKKRYQ